MRDYFVLIYPEAVQYGRALEILQALLRSGAKLVERCARPLNMDEAKAIFLARRHDPNFEEFCRQHTKDKCWLLHLQHDDLMDLVNSHMNREYHRDMYIPGDVVEHQAFVCFVDNDQATRARLTEIIDLVREKMNHDDMNEYRRFHAMALQQGYMLFNYFTAMRMSGFDETEAFSLTTNAQSWLFERSELFEEEVDDDDVDFDTSEESSDEETPE